MFRYCRFLQLKLSHRAANEYERLVLLGRRRDAKNCVARVRESIFPFKNRTLRTRKKSFFQVDKFSQLASPILFMSFVLYYVFSLTQGNEASCVMA